MICDVNLAESFVANFGVHTETLEFYKKALGILKSIYGDGHPSAKGLQDKIAKIQEMQKEPNIKLNFHIVRWQNNTKGLG